jgi:4-hydroxybenzoate polyprenyltransferase
MNAAGERHAVLIECTGGPILTGDYSGFPETLRNRQTRQPHPNVAFKNTAPDSDRKMTRWFRFFRWPNLLIIGVTMAMMRYLVVAPQLAEAGRFALGTFSFICLVTATILIAAAGYVANDIRDQGMDAVNRPDRLFVGRHLAEAAAWRLYLTLDALAILVFAALVVSAGFEGWMLVIPLSMGLLLVYGFRLKCTPVIGNLTVALLSAIVPFVVLASEVQALVIPAGAKAIQLGGAYSLFAFAASMFREGVKDLEDADGDSLCGCRTLAVRDPALARVGAFLAMAALAAGVFLFLRERDVSVMTWIVGVSFVLIPAGSAALLLILARDTADFSRLSTLSKIVMLGGLALLPLLVA